MSLGLWNTRIMIPVTVILSEATKTVAKKAQKIMWLQQNSNPDHETHLVPVIFYQISTFYLLPFISVSKKRVQ